MVRHLFNRALWRGTKCHPAGVLGIVMLFVFLHVLLVRIGKYRNTKERDDYVTFENSTHETTDLVHATPDNRPIKSMVADTEPIKSMVTDTEPIKSMVADTEPIKSMVTEGPSLSQPFINSGSVMEKQQICMRPSVLPEVLEERRNRAKVACKRLRRELPYRWSRRDRGPSTGILAKLRWDAQHHLLYCHLPKVASTTWAWHLLRGVGMKDEEIAAHRNVHILLQERLPPPSPEDFDNGFLRDALSFVVSRHPYHRLVSAYKNKIVEAEKRRQHYVDLRKTILEKYHRPWDSPVTLPTFRDFCEYVADSIEDWLEDLNHTPPPDPHWMPMVYVCSPCNLRYDVFSKMETMEADTTFIAAQCGLSDIIKSDIMFNPSDVKVEEEELVNNSRISMSNSLFQAQDTKGLSGIHTLEKANYISFQDSNDINMSVEMTGDNGNETKDSESKSYADYFKELSEEELQRLYKIYRFDFEIFGYTMDKFR